MAQLNINTDKFEIMITQAAPVVGTETCVEPPDGGGWILVNSEAVGSGSKDYVSLTWVRQK